jgi:hypothetical protein
MSGDETGYVAFINSGRTAEICFKLDRELALFMFLKEMCIFS